jgi:uncharacterized protein (TIGR03032 family)
MLAAMASSLEILGSRGLPGWLASQAVSLAFTTYQAGKLFLVGLQPGGRLALFERTFNRCMGLCASGDGLWMSTLYQLWRFENVLPAGQEHDGHDRLYVPMRATRPVTSTCTTSRCWATGGWCSSTRCLAAWRR